MQDSKKGFYKYTGTKRKAWSKQQPLLTPQQWSQSLSSQKANRSLEHALFLLSLVTFSSFLWLEMASRGFPKEPRLGWATCIPSWSTTTEQSREPHDKNICKRPRLPFFPVSTAEVCPPAFQVPAASGRVWKGEALLTAEEDWLRAQLCKLDIYGTRCGAPKLQKETAKVSVSLSFWNVAAIMG